MITKWNIAKAIEAFDDESVDPIIQKLDVHYQIGHTNASMSETKDADGKWLIALCKFSKDRFLPVGPLHAENDQLIDISGEKMKLVHDGPAYPEPHDCVVVRRDLIHPSKIDPRTGRATTTTTKLAKEDGVDLMNDSKVIRKGKGKVRVYVTSAAPVLRAHGVPGQDGRRGPGHPDQSGRVSRICHTASACPTTTSTWW